MANPWETISLEDYEGHMSLDQVRQLQALDSIMHDQFEAYPADTAMVLGVAGGNGLEHVRCDKYRAVYGVDINVDYLRAVRERYGDLNGVLRCVQLDIINDADKLPHADLVIADLIIEYIGYEAFKTAVLQTAPEYVSCVIQINADAGEWVSDSPYLHAFDCLDEVHHILDRDSLAANMRSIGYGIIREEREELPNGKALLRTDYRKETSGGVR